MASPASGGTIAAAWVGGGPRCRSSYLDAGGGCRSNAIGAAQDVRRKRADDRDAASPVFSRSRRSAARLFDLRGGAVAGGSFAKRVHHHGTGEFPGQITDLGRLVTDGRYVHFINPIGRAVRGNRPLELSDRHEHVDVGGVEAGFAV